MEYVQLGRKVRLARLTASKQIQKKLVKKAKNKKA
jgi:hypothetical protein